MAAPAASSFSAQFQVGANSGETIAGFSRAESWDGSYPQTSLADNGGGKGLTAVAYSPAKSGQRGADGGSGGAGGSAGDRGIQGGNGYIKLALNAANGTCHLVFV